VVAGLKYTIQIEMGTSECFKTVESSSLDECPVAGDTEIHSLVVSDQPWLSPRFQLLSHNTEVDVVPAPMVGAPGSIDNAEENMLAALEAGMVLLNAQSNSLYLHQAIRVISATKQVVAGLKYTIQIEMGTSECFKTVESSSLDECPVAGDTAVTELVVIDQAWMAPRYTLLSSALVSDPIESVSDPEPVGGAAEVSLDDEAMLAALEAGIFKLNEQSNTENLEFVVGRVLQVTRQVVAGLKYIIRVEMCETAAEPEPDWPAGAQWAGQHQTLKDCSVGSTSIHELTIWDKPWETERYELLGHSIVAEFDLPEEPPLTEPELEDGPQTIDPMDDAVVAALQAGMTLLNAESGYSFLYQPVRVVEATQVVADGLMYTLLVELGASECSNTGVAQSIVDCPVVGETEFLKIVIWDQPWQPEGSRYALGNHPLIKKALETEDAGDQSADEIWADAAMVNAIGIAMAAAALVLVPAMAWWYFKVHKPSHDAVLVMTEEPSAHDQL